MNQIKFDPTIKNQPLTWQKETKCFSIELSEISQCSNISKYANFKFGAKIEVLNTANNSTILFECFKVDKDGSGEDTYGWQFRSVSGAQFPCKLLVVND